MKKKEEGLYRCMCTGVRIENIHSEPVILFFTDLPFNKSGGIETEILS